MDLKFVNSLVQKIPKGFSGSDISLRSKDINRVVATSYSIPDKNNIPAIYVFNYSDGGIAFISADDRHEPLLSVQDEGSLHLGDTIPGGLDLWLLATVENIEILRDNLYDNTDKAHKLWWHFIDDVGINSTLVPDSVTIILGLPCNGCVTPCASQFYTTGPFLSTTWGQGCSYNELCPNLKCTDVCPTNQNAYTGCVATAMAQIIRYWAPPSPNYSVCNTAGYLNVSYDYTSMPTAQGNIEVQRLMRDIGKNVCMDYGCKGSGATSSSARLSMEVNYQFPYATLEDFNGYATQISSDMDNTRPVLVGGCMTIKLNWPFKVYGDCHMWVLDGQRVRTYSDCSGYMQYHMNWGWNGQKNGWYIFTNWTVPGYNYNFQYAKDIIHNIYPNS